LGSNLETVKDNWGQTQTIDWKNIGVGATHLTGLLPASPAREGGEASLNLILKSDVRNVSTRAEEWTVT
jgi:hypothetical protein